MSINTDNLPYRNNVAGIVFKGDKFLLVQRIDWESELWKFPQGGVKENENIKKAIIRELKEELGTNKFKIIGKSINTNLYDWDDYTLQKIGYRWRGQNQFFFLIEFLGEDKDLKLPKDEIKNYKWVKENELKQNIDHLGKNYLHYYETVKKIIVEFRNILIRSS